MATEYMTALETIVSNFVGTITPGPLINTLGVQALPCAEAAECAAAIRDLQHTSVPLAADSRPMLLMALQHMIQAAPVEGLEVLGRLLEFQVISFGEYLDVYAELLERCTLDEASLLCGHFAGLNDLFAAAFDQQDLNGRRVSRARLLGMANAFEKKLFWTEAESVLADLHRLCYDLMPISFQGICNRGLRDCPGKHFVIPEPRSSHDLCGEASDVEEDPQPDEGGGGEASDSSSGSVKNFKAVGDKRRRTATGTHPEQSMPLTTRRTVVVPTPSHLYAHWKGVVALLQDPVLVLSSCTIGRALELIHALHGTVQFFRTHPASPRDLLHVPAAVKEEEFSMIPTASSLSEEQTSSDQNQPRDASPTTGTSHHVADVDPTSLPAAPAETGDDVTFPWKKRLDVTLRTYDSRMSFPAFSQHLLSESFRRDIALRTSAMLREIFFKRRSASSSTFENLHQTVRNALVSLSDAVYRLQKQITSCAMPFPAVSFSGIPWFARPAHWSPPATLASLIAELDSQEIMMAYWKWDGCGEPKEPFWAQGDSSSVSTSTVDASDILRYASPHAGLWTSTSAMVDDAKEHRRYELMRERFLPVVRAFAENRRHPVSEDATTEIASDDTSQNGVRVIGGLLAPPTFSRERQAWYLPAPPHPVDLRTATVFEKLQEKWMDYKTKVTSDEDPQNQIEEDEKVVKDSLFQWRCHRLLNLTSLQLYDYSHQDRDLRMKVRFVVSGHVASVEQIREASLEDLIQAVIQKESLRQHTL